MTSSFFDLPLQVKDGGIYWLNSSAAATAAATVAAAADDAAVVAAPSPSRTEEDMKGRRGNMMAPPTTYPPPQPTGAGEPADDAQNQPFCFWHQDQDLQWRLDGPWSRRARSLLEEEEGGGTTATTEMKIKESALIDLVQKLGGDATCAQHVCCISNGKRPKMRAPETSPEMAFQQLIFPPITGLFYCLDPDRYAADSVVRNGYFRYQNKDGVPVTLIEIKPDAAVMLSKGHLVLAILELKKKGPHKGDMMKCVLIASVSALALVREGGLGEVTIPMVVNDGELAYLYIVTVQKDNECPIVELILVANMSVASETAEAVAHVAVIVQLLMQSLNESKVAKRFRLSLDAFPKTSSSRSASKSSRRGAERRSDHPGSLRDDDDETSTRSTQKRQRVGPEDHERSKQAAAALVATCEGRVTCVRPPFDDDSRGSPFYFVGVRARTNVPVFIKVWRDNNGDEKTTTRRRHDVESEIRFLRAARRHRVPCPEVVDPCTAFDVDGGCGGTTFHRLVMHKLPDDPVGGQDVLPFAVSLIDGVLALHEANILHCDIKPNNVVWDAFAHTASLVDFGHAQAMRHAQPYTGTVGYTAPEVVDKSSPHSPISEAYSVGKTIEYVCGRARHTKDVDRVLTVAASLSREDPASRITLERALDELRALKATNG